MRKEFSAYFKNKKIRNWVLIILLAIFSFVIINGLFIYFLNLDNFYFYIVKKIIPYPAYIVGNKVVTFAEYDDILSSYNRIYEAAYSTDFTGSSEGQKNKENLDEKVKNETIDKIIMEGVLKSIDKSVSNNDIKNEYENIIKNIGSDKEINNLLKYSSNVTPNDIKNIIYINLLKDRVKENVVVSLKMKVIAVHPDDINKKEDWDKAKEKIDGILKEVRSDGSKFNQYYAIGNNANDPIVQNFGKDYYFADDLPENFKQTFFALSPGQFSDVLKNDVSYYILKAEDKKGYYRGTLDDFLKEQRSKIKIWTFKR